MEEVQSQADMQWAAESAASGGEVGFGAAGVCCSQWAANLSRMVEGGGAGLSLSLEASVGEVGSVEDARCEMRDARCGMRDAALAVFGSAMASRGRAEVRALCDGWVKYLGVGCRVCGRRYMAGDGPGWDGPRFRFRRAWLGLSGVSGLC